MNEVFFKVLYFEYLDIFFLPSFERYTQYSVAFLAFFQLTLSDAFLMSETLRFVTLAGVFLTTAVVVSGATVGASVGASVVTSGVVVT